MDIHMEERSMKLSFSAASPGGRRRAVAAGASLVAAAAALSCVGTASAAAPGPVATRASAALTVVHPQAVKPRTVVTTDMEQDDYASLIRYLLYTDDVDTQGIVYTAGRFHWAGDGKGTLFFLP